MIKRLIILFILFTTIFACSSKNKSIQNIDYIIYGVYCGECMHHCATMYKLEKTKLLIDTTDSYFSVLRRKIKTNEPVIFKNDTLSKEAFLNAQLIKSEIPTLLLRSTNREFGNPDSHDQCGIFIQFKINNTLKTFRLDTELDKLPKDLREYAKLIMKTSGFKPL